MIPHDRLAADHHRPPNLTPHKITTILPFSPDSLSWDKPPPFIPIIASDHERIPIRNANHHAYCMTGTPTMWQKYINLGYYIFDDCMQFQSVWRSMTRDAIVQERYKVIWKSYHYHRMNNITINPTLDKSAIHTVRPYLKAKDPDYSNNKRFRFR
jgi:hypothetical protein